MQSSFLSSSTIVSSNCYISELGIIYLYSSVRLHVYNLGEEAQLWIVPSENLNMIEEFRVVTMAESIDEMKLRGKPLRVPDHSLLLWEVVMKDARVWEDVESEQGKEPESKVRYKVLEGYLKEDRHTLQDLLESIRRLDGGQ